MWSSPLVAPHMGAWIEINSKDALSKHVEVAPHMGAWIEIKTDWVLDR